MDTSLDKYFDILGEVQKTTMQSPTEVGTALHNFAEWFLNLTEEEKMNIVVGYFKDPPTKDDQGAINGWKNRHPDAWINQFNESR